MEHLDRVRDGSENKLANGYNTVNICFSSKNKKHPIPVSFNVWSAKEPGFVSQNNEYFAAIDEVDDFFGDKRFTFVLDRGFDSYKLFEYILDRDRDFIVRMKKNRNVIFKNKVYSTHEMGLRRKGKIKFTTKIDGKKIDLRLSRVNIKLPSIKSKYQGRTFELPLSSRQVNKQNIFEPCLIFMHGFLYWDF